MKEAVYRSRILAEQCCRRAGVLLVFAQYTIGNTILSSDSQSMLLRCTVPPEDCSQFRNARFRAVHRDARDPTPQVLCIVISIEHPMVSNEYP